MRECSHRNQLYYRCSCDPHPNCLIYCAPLLHKSIKRLLMMLQHDNTATLQARDTRVPRLNTDTRVPRLNTDTPLANGIFSVTRTARGHTSRYEKESITAKSDRSKTSDKSLVQTNFQRSSTNITPHQLRWRLL